MTANPQLVIQLGQELNTSLTRVGVDDRVCKVDLGIGGGRRRLCQQP